MITSLFSKVQNMK